MQLGSKKIIRSSVYGALAMLTVFALGISTYWFVTAGSIRTELERLEGGEIVPGVTLQFAAMNIGGFPFRFDIVLGGVTIAALGQTDAWAWRSERIALYAAGYGHAPYVLEADGLQTFSWPADDGGPQNILQMTSTLTRASALIEDGRLQRFDVDILNAEGQDGSLDAEPMRSFHAARMQLRSVVQEDENIAFVAALDAGTIGVGYRPALGTDLSRLRIEGEVAQAQDFRNLRAGTAGVQASFDVWRERSGEISLPRIEAAWGGTLLQGSGRLFLDEGHRLAGQVSASPEDPVSFLGALAQSEMLPLETRTQLGDFHQMVAGLPGNLELPIRLQARLPLGPEPSRPQFRIEGMNAIVIEFGSETP